MTISLSKLSPEERKALKEEMRQEEAREKEQRKQYKELASKEVETQVDIIRGLYIKMRQAKIEAYNTLLTLIETKNEVFEVKDGQKSHTFTSLDGTKRIEIGVRDISQWDGSESAGIAKINEYLKSLAKDSKSADQVRIIVAMLKPDKKGMLDPRRILELSKVAEEAGNELFMDGINIIMEAYKVVGTKMFLECQEKDEQNGWRNIAMNYNEIKLE